LARVRAKSKSRASKFNGNTKGGSEMARDFLMENQKLNAAAGMIGAQEAPRQMTRLERYHYEKRNLEQRIALLDEAIAALKSNPETERIINLLDAL
jgi:hypothetical protein